MFVRGATKEQEFYDFFVTLKYRLLFQVKMRVMFARFDKRYARMADLKSLRGAQIATVLAVDWEFVKLSNWRSRPQVTAWHRNVVKGRPLPRDNENILILGLSSTWIDKFEKIPNFIIKLNKKGKLILESKENIQS